MSNAPDETYANNAGIWGDGNQHPWAVGESFSVFNTETPSTVVTTVSDVVDVTDGVVSLREAIAYANSYPALGGTVTFSSMLKEKTISLSGAEITLSSGVTIDASALYNSTTGTPGLTLDGGGLSRIFRITGGTASDPATLIGLKITNGSDLHGGGLKVEAGAALLAKDCVFVDNKTTKTSGGGLCVDGWTNLERCVVSGNASAENGGGIYVATSGSLTATETTISGNSATWGGGLQTWGTTQIANSTISNNVATDGGGMYLGATATITNATIAGNNARVGGGLELHSNVFATLENSTISNNVTTENGGGGYTVSGSNLTVVNSTISGNSAVWGGGLQIWGTAEIVNSAIVDNAATSGGGGLYLAGTTTIRNSTIAGNNAGWGGGFQLHTNISATLYNSIVALNTASSNSQISKSGTLTAYNTLSSYTSWDSGSSNYTYSSSSPLFTNAANGDYTLAANSQALDKGNNSYISGYTTDLAGKTRVSGTYVDLGAYEYQQTTPLSTPSLSVSAKSSSELSITIGYVSNASRYTLEYSTSSSFTTKTTKTYSSYGTYTLSGLNANTKYYVRVKAVGTGAYADSSWSSVKNATTWETPSLVVTTNSEVVDATDGLISLREAIQYAEADSSLGSTITFAASMKGKTIALSGTQLTISKALTIDASALYDASTCTPGITIDADGLSRVFYVNAGTTSTPVELIALAMANGYENYGGAIYVASSAALSMAKCDVVDNEAANAGGGIYSVGVLDVTDLCWIYCNSAPYGGGVYSLGSLVLTDAHVFSNSGTWGGGVYSIGTLTSTSSFYNGNDAILGGGGVHVAR